MIEIPYQRLDMSILQALIESFINREGTDYGEVELSLNEKCALVMQQLEEKAIVIAFDELSESCNLLGVDEWRRLETEYEKEV